MKDNFFKKKENLVFENTILIFKSVHTVIIYNVIDDNGRWWKVMEGGTLLKVRQKVNLII